MYYGSVGPYDLQLEVSGASATGRAGPYPINLVTEGANTTGTMGPFSVALVLSGNTLTGGLTPSVGAYGQSVEHMCYNINLTLQTVSTGQQIVGSIGPYAVFLDLPSSAS